MWLCMCNVCVGVHEHGCVTVPRAQVDVRYLRQLLSTIFFEMVLLLALNMMISYAGCLAIPSNPPASRLRIGLRGLCVIRGFYVCAVNLI